MPKTLKPKSLFFFVILLCVFLFVSIFYFFPAPKAWLIFNLYNKSKIQTPTTISYPLSGTIFPPEIYAPTFQFNTAATLSNQWLISIQDYNKTVLLNCISNKSWWKPSKQQWEMLKNLSKEHPLKVAIVGFTFNPLPSIVSYGETSFYTSKDSVGDPLFYREVILPFSEAVKDPSKIKWRFGSITKEEQPPVVLENLPVCGNCHSFSANGSTLGMDVDYGNDKGAYALTKISKQTILSPSNIISWNDYKRDKNNPTFGLLSQVSPDGRFVASTVKDRSIFVAKPDLAFSQLFFPLQGILAIYSQDTKTIQALPGADDPAYVQSNPSWSPDGNYIVFARAKEYKLQNLRDKSQALLSPQECSAFLTNTTLFKYDLYRIPFNNGRGGTAESLLGASNDSQSNFFAKYSPDGKWIVFCKSSSFMLLQPDSKLYIIPAHGGNSQLMTCNTNLMNSWHTWSSNSRWLAFVSKKNSAYSQVFLTHVDTNGNDAPPVLLQSLTSANRAANIPEFVHTSPRAIQNIQEQFVDDMSLWRAGKAFEDAGDLQSAILKYQQALAINKNNAKVHVSLGNILENQGKNKDALEHYCLAIKADSTLAIAQVNAGNIHFKQGNTANALPFFEKAVTLDHKEPFAHYNLGLSYNKLNKPKDAIAQFKETLQLIPDDALSWFSLGQTYAKTGNTDDAVISLKKGIALMPTDPAGYKLLADILIKANRKQEAKQYYEQTLKIKPDLGEVLDSLAKLQ